MANQQMGLFEDYPVVNVVRSARRKKTIEATEQNGVLTITVPDRISQREERHWVKEMIAVAKDRALTDDEDLARVTEALAERYRLPRPDSIIWIPDQKTRWAYCDIQTREISVCDQVKRLPRWVIDYVIVHELAHLCEPRHNKRFWQLVNKYPKTERARGYLMAKAEGLRDL